MIRLALTCSSSQTDRSRGFGFITMRSTADAERCIEKLNGLMLHGRPIRVDFSATQKPHQPTPGQYMGEKKPLRGGFGSYQSETMLNDQMQKMTDPGPDETMTEVATTGDTMIVVTTTEGTMTGAVTGELGRTRHIGVQAHTLSSRDYRPRRDHDDPYGGRSRRDDERRRSPR